MPERVQETEESWEAPSCPNCGGQDSLGEIDLVPGIAWISRVSPSGKIEWAGETKMIWDNQYPAHDPPQIVCRECDEVFWLRDGRLEPYDE